MQFSELLATLKPRDGAWSVELGTDWAQGRTIFGGLQAAVAVRAMRELVAAEIPLRVLQTTFIAPLAPGPVRVEARVLRTGKSVTHVEARLLSAGQVGCLVVGIFGAGRESQIRVDLQPPRDVPTPEQSQGFPYIEGITPAFTRHVTMRWAGGTLPFMGAKEAKTQIYVGLKDEPFAGLGPAAEYQIIAYADIIPSPGISLLKKPAMASSLTWTLELLSDRFDASAEGLWLMDAEVSSGRDGYLSQSATLWTPQWQAAALSRQSVVAFG
jgi:acyl-CoA thioesterase